MSLNNCLILRICSGGLFERSNAGGSLNSSSNFVAESAQHSAMAALLNELFKAHAIITEHHRNVGYLRVDMVHVKESPQENILIPAG